MQKKWMSSPIGMAGGALLVCAILSSACRPVRTEGPDVLLIILDTVRPDHLGCYGYYRDTSPNMDSLAGSGTRFLNAQAQAPWTVPASASIFTGLSPRSHRAGFVVDRVCGLDPVLHTIPALMFDAGYETFGEFSIAWFGRDFGFHNGFESFRCFADEERHAFQVADDFACWIDTLPSDRRYFAMLHFYEAHAPYTPPAPFDTLFPYDSMPWPDDSVWLVSESDSILHPDQLDCLTARYDGEIRYVDDAIGRVIDALKGAGRSDEVLIVITSDHGEEFLEHGGYSHGRTLYQEVLWVPLILSGPGVPGGAEPRQPVAAMDILPTVLSRAGLPVPPEVEGIDLLAEPVFDRYIPSNEPKGPPLFCIRRSDLKLIWNPDTGEAVMYDLGSDPGEQVPLPADSTLLEDLADYLALRPLGNASAVPEDDLDRSLQGLGYIR
jgi:arylsulfatase A-like enzyme